MNRVTLLCETAALLAEAGIFKSPKEMVFEEDYKQYFINYRSVLSKAVLESVLWTRTEKLFNLFQVFGKLLYYSSKQQVFGFELYILRPVLTSVL